MGEIATYFGVTDSLAITSSTTYTTGATDNSWNKIVQSGNIVVGYTVFAPIAYEDTTNNFSGNKFTNVANKIILCSYRVLNV